MLKIEQKLATAHQISAMTYIPKIRGKGKNTKNERIIFKRVLKELDE
jgi:hypothetical protein